MIGIKSITAQSAEAIEYSDCISKLHLIVRLQSLELWGVWITSSLSLLPVSVRVLSMGQIELFNLLLLILNRIICVKYQYLKAFN